MRTIGVGAGRARRIERHHLVVGRAVPAAAAARASSAAIGAGAARMSTTTISLPRPFIFTKAWPASALIGRPVDRAVIWRKIGAAPAAAHGAPPHSGRHIGRRRAMNRRRRPGPGGRLGRLRCGLRASPHRCCSPACWPRRTRLRPDAARRRQPRRPRRHAASAARRSRAMPFGEEVTLTAKTIVFSKGTANWDSAFETLVEAFKNVYGALQKQGLKPAGPADDDLYGDRRHRLRVPGRRAGRRGAEGAAAGRARGRKIARGAGRSSSSIAAPTTRWTRPTRRSPIISTRSGSKRKDLFVE